MKSMASDSATHMLSTIFLVLCSILCCYSRDSITLDDFLIDDGGETLVSANQTFELVFFSPNKGKFNDMKKFIRIWYYGLKERKVV